MDAFYSIASSSLIILLTGASIWLLFSGTTRYNMRPVWWVSLLYPPLSFVAYYRARYKYLTNNNAEEPVLRQAGKYICISVIYIALLWLVILGSIIRWAFQPVSDVSPAFVVFWGILLISIVYLWLIRRSGGLKEITGAIPR